MLSSEQKISQPTHSVFSEPLPHINNQFINLFMLWRVQESRVIRLSWTRYFFILLHIYIYKVLTTPYEFTLGLSIKPKFRLAKIVCPLQSLLTKQYTWLFTILGTMENFSWVTNWWWPNRASPHQVIYRTIFHRQVKDNQEFTI